jgi:hypothetical protein
MPLERFWLVCAYLKTIIVWRPEGRTPYMTLLPLRYFSKYQLLNPHVHGPTITLPQQIPLFSSLVQSLSLSLSLSPTHTQRTIAQRRDGQKMFFQLLVLTYYCNTSLQSLIFR